MHDCALEHGLDFDRINDCVSNDDGRGVRMLRESVERSAEANVTTSCTVRLQGEVRCIRDDGEWKDCKRGPSVSRLVEDIEKVFSELNQ